RSIASAHPRRTGWRAGVPATLPARRLWIAVALLLAASLVAYVLIGSRQPRQVVIAVDPAHPIPAELFGIWSLGPASDEFPNGRTWLDFNAPELIHQPDGTPVTSLGRATAFEGTGQTQGELTVRAPGDCGEGRYLVLIEAGLRLSPISDPCVARLETLRSTPWLRVSERLRVGATVNSLQFTEP